MNAQLLNPFDNEVWKGARAYTTNFDTNLYDFAIKNGKLPQFRRNIEREIKVLLLTKNKVVTGASSMITPFGYDFLRENPLLLKEKLLIPAVGNHVVGEDYEAGMNTSTLTDYYINRIKTQNIDLIKNLSSFFNDNIRIGVGWNHQNNTSGFKQKIIDGLNNEGSIIRCNLDNISKETVNRLIQSFTAVETEFSRKDIEKIVGDIGLTKKQADVIFKYQELSYNVSGATVVNAEASLLNEDLVLDYELSDFKEKRSLLTEKQIFFKVFFELFFENILNTTAIPINALDYLSFEEIHKIRNEFHDSGFIESYNSIINEVNSVYNLNHTQNIDPENLRKVGNEIEKRFQLIFDYVRKVAIEKGMIKELSIRQNNIGYGLANFYDSHHISSINQNSISYITDFPSLFQNRSYLEKQDIDSLSKFNFLKTSKFLSLLNNSEIQPIVAFASEIQQQLHQKLSKRPFIA
jgi:hypothetical protein